MCMSAVIVYLHQGRVGASEGMGFKSAPCRHTPTSLRNELVALFMLKYDTSVTFENVRESMFLRV
jgi:hypothetical protein